MNIFLTKKGEKLGPYSFEEIRRQLAVGDCVTTDWAWREGLDGWVELSELLAAEPMATKPEDDAQKEVAAALPAAESESRQMAGDTVDGRSLGGQEKLPDAVNFDEISEPMWLHRSSEGELTEVDGASLTGRLQRQELDSKGWLWTPGMLAWSSASQAESLVEAFDPDRQPPPMPPVRSDADPLDEMKKAARTSFDSLKKYKDSWHLILLQFVPVVASIVNRGWRLETIRRPTDDLLPGPDQLPRMAIQGSILWAMYSLYLLPVMIFLLFDSFGWFFDFIGLCKYIFGVIASQNPASGLGAFFSSVGMGFIFKSGFMIFYPIASWPLYRVAMLRYAHSRNVSTFFEFRVNGRIAKKCYPLIMHVYAQSKLLWLFAGIVGTLVSMTGIGFLLVPGLILPLRLLSSGLLYRNLGDKLRASGYLEGYEQNVAVIDAAQAPADIVTRPEQSQGRRWFGAEIGGDVTEITQGELAARWTSAEKKSSDSAGQLPDLIWTTGMWRWQRPAEASEFVNRLAASPPQGLAETSGSTVWADRIKSLPATIKAQFNPRDLWADLKCLLFDTKDGDIKGLWKSRLAWFVLLQYVPIVASVVNKGWRIDLMRSSTAEGLPSRRNLGRHLAEGLLLWGIYLIYLLPFFFLLVLTEFKWLEQVIGLMWWAVQASLGGTPAQTLGEILGSGFFRFFFETLLNIAYPMVSWPFFRGAMIRYALEDNLRVFWQLKKNYKFSKLNFETFTGMYLAQKTLWGIYILLSMLLLATGIGGVLIPGILSPFRLLASGVVYMRGMRKAPSMKGYFPA